MAILKIWDEATSTWFEVPIEDPALYLLLDGTRAMTGALDMGANAIASVGTVDGRDVSADGDVLDAHIVDSTDPHGAILTLTTKLITPMIQKVFGDLTIDALNTVGHSMVFILNGDATYKASLNVERHLTIGGAAGYGTLYDNGDVNGAITIDWNNGNVQKMTLTGNVTSVAFTNPPDTCNCRLWIHQDGTGGRTVAGWDADVDWGGSAPVVSAGVSKFNIGVFEYNGGSIYAAQLVQGIDGTGFG